MCRKATAANTGLVKVAVHYHTKKPNLFDEVERKEKVFYKLLELKLP